MDIVSETTFFSTISTTPSVALLDVLKDAIAILDSAGMLCYINTAWKRIYGDSIANHSDFQQTDNHSLSIATMLAQHDSDVQKLANGIHAVRGAAIDYFTCECYTSCKSGEHTGKKHMRWFETTITPYQLNDERHILIQQRDITRWKMMEDHYKTLYTKQAFLNSTNAELLRLSRLKDEFLASMSHELRTPLSAILGLTEALQEEVYGPLTTRQATSLHNIEESGRHLLELINDILDLSKIEAGKLELNIATIPLESLCQASIRFIQAQAYRKRITVSCHIDEQVASVSADERRLKQILINLLSNAVKFTHERGNIGLAVHRNDEQHAICFTVWDTGIGIAQADMDRLFEPFVQIHPHRVREQEGTGLGLVLVSRLTEMHGGWVTVESTPSQGSRFTVAIPCI